MDDNTRCRSNTGRRILILQDLSSVLRMLQELFPVLCNLQEQSSVLRMLRELSSVLRMLQELSSVLRMLQELSSGHIPNACLPEAATISPANVAASNLPCQQSASVAASNPLSAWLSAIREHGCQQCASPARKYRICALRYAPCDTRRARACAHMPDPPDPLHSFPPPLSAPGQSGLLASVAVAPPEALRFRASGAPPATPADPPLRACRRASRSRSQSARGGRCTHPCGTPRTRRTRPAHTQTP
eukprot:361357-Chlamydomonas_euryale.AAC.2